ncbi:Uu.00g060580.m01.CDS01 [Anthostomella pinea]|uniref:Uu.00g060580.m01.CDS01 n=1 Tax=Anthostomella pinea TaxID=933095 RepID=A0AAI8YMC3_9PEZI|nr:Uu.00g060580.m01.CDS01 [Anthostomella pinea]
MDKKKRLVFQLDTPYSAVSWPEIQPEDQETILELLCTLLAPLGRHRSEHARPSKGKRAKKRKRKEASEKETDAPSPPAPEILSYVDVGLTTVTRNMQKQAAEGRLLGLLPPGQTSAEVGNSAGRFYSVVFVARSGQANMLNSHLPQMVAVASNSHPSRIPTRLVGLSKACEDRLSESLGIPRASCIALCDDAPNSEALVEFIRQRVPIVDVPWLKVASQAEHQPTKINTIETSIGAKKQRSKV